jgi:hypothetical protein
MSARSYPVKIKSNPQFLSASPASIITVITSRSYGIASLSTQLGVMHYEETVNIRKYQNTDRGALIELWKTVFPDDPPHNEPSIVIDAKLAVDDLIFVAEHKGKLVGACMVG